MSASHVHAPNPQHVDGVLQSLEEWWIQQGRAPRATHQADRNGSLELGRVLINPCCKRSSLNVRFAPKATELLRRREMTQRGQWRTCGESVGPGEARQHERSILRMIGRTASVTSGASGDE
jgi:hypothetical protein